MNKQYSLVKELRNAIDNNEKSITVNAETRTVTVQGYGEDPSQVPGVHDQVVETEVQGILEPLYANSVLSIYSHILYIEKIAESLSILHILP